MPRYGRKRVYSKPFRRYGKKYGRARWKNKKFSKFNNKTRASIKGLIMPKSAYVKLPFRQIGTTTAIIANNSVAQMWVPTAYIPYPTDYTTSATEVRAQAGDRFTNGILQYAQFFDTGYVLGSSIKLQIMNCNSTAVANNTTPQILATLVCYPYDTQRASSTGSFSLRRIYDYLNSLTNDNLQSLAYAQSRIVSLGYSKSEIFMKMFRKTKSMCGVKDIEDNDDMEIRLPKLDIDYEAQDYCAGQGFVYYLRLTNLADNTNQQVLRINSKITQYWKLTSRRAVLQGVAENET